MNKMENPYEERIHFLKYRIDSISESMNQNEEIYDLRSFENSPMVTFKSNLELYKDLCGLEIELEHTELNYNSFKELNRLKDDLVQYRQFLVNLKKSLYDRI